MFGIKKGGKPLKRTKWKDLSDRGKLRRVALLVGAVLLALVVLSGVLWLVGFLLQDSPKRPESLSSDRFYEADYDRNIFEDPAYQRLDRSVRYLEYGSGETITEENYQSLGVASEFFHDYFDAIIRGDCEAYRSFLTPYYVRTFEPSERFTMQMLYDIEVNRTQTRASAEYEGQEVPVYYFEVKYKIFENNGTFRDDVESNRSTTQYYELYDLGDRLVLNAISEKQVILQ